MGRDKYGKMPKLPKLGSPVLKAVNFKNASGAAGTHKAKPRIEPSVDDYLDEMEEERVERELEAKRAAAENAEIMKDIKELEDEEPSSWSERDEDENIA